MPDMQQPIAANGPTAADTVLLLAGVDHDALGFECAHPLLQIDCWADAVAGGTAAAPLCAADGH